MDFGPESYASRRDTVAFIVCLVLAVGARATPASVSDGVASLLRESVLLPLLALQEQTELVRGRRAEFERAIAERDSAIINTNQLEVVRAENDRLRAVMRLRSRMNVRHVPAEILHQIQPSGWRTLVATAGTGDSVRQWAPVVTESGLVGNVQTVDKNTSVIHTWTHPDFRASATTRDGRVSGIVAPRTGGGVATFLELREVPYVVDVNPGDSIITAGIGGVYPRGIPIGVVRVVIGEQAGFTKTYLIEPAVHLTSLSHVLIVLAEGMDVEPVFSGLRP